MKKVLLSLLLFVSSISFGNDNSCLQIDIILVADFSSSVENYQYFISSALQAFANRFELSEGTVKIGLIVFSDYPRLLCPLTSDGERLKKEIDEVSTLVPEGETYMGEAFLLAMDEINKNGRAGYKRMIIIISDGYPTWRESTLRINNQVKGNNISVCSVLIKVNVCDGEFMKDISTNCYVESNYENLILALESLDVCI